LLYLLEKIGAHHPRCKRLVQLRRAGDGCPK
jgi:hypothetical protein